MMTMRGTSDDEEAEEEEEEDEDEAEIPAILDGIDCLEAEHNPGLFITNSLVTSLLNTVLNGTISRGGGETTPSDDEFENEDENVDDDDENVDDDDDRRE